MSKTTISVEQCANRNLIDGLMALRGIPIPGRQAYELDRATRKITEAHGTFTKLRSDWIQKNGEKDPNGDGFIVRFKGEQDPKKIAFNKYLQEIGDEQFEISLREPIPFPDGLSLSADQVSALVDANIIAPPAEEKGAE